MEFAWIQTEKASYPLTKLCRWLGVTPSGFYAWRQRPESTHVREDRRLKVRVQASFAESKQRYGSPRIHADLMEQDEQVSRKRVIRSDQGCTCASADYQALLDAHGIVCSMSRRGNCHDNAVMESFFSTVKSELADRFDTYGDAKMELFDYIEVFYNQRRRHSTLGQISPAAFERRANEEGVEPMENCQGRGFPQAPHPLSFSMRKEQTTKNDQLNETVH